MAEPLVFANACGRSEDESNLSGPDIEGECRCRSLLVGANCSFRASGQSVAPVVVSRRQCPLFLSHFAGFGVAGRVRASVVSGPDTSETPVHIVSTASTPSRMAPCSSRGWRRLAGLGAFCCLEMLTCCVISFVSGFLTDPCWFSSTHHSIGMNQVWRRRLHCGRHEITVIGRQGAVVSH